jgi:hypothetical protein
MDNFISRMDHSCHRYMTARFLIPLLLLCGPYEKTIHFCRQPGISSEYNHGCSWLGDITDSESEETADEENEPSESLTLEGLSPQGEYDLAIACSLNPEGC